ncbi:VMAP-C domain-containing protein [Rhizobium ruizarguesonis]|uniref:VMAP-C domain-containing protein n=1 Tax=Rhizobium ruizarguesonis TaxID=2081791 RepID=UPI00102F3BDA|nr:caspase family protein [Rhizobium ruizarguesonis]TAV19056.1 hypothetical protein ELI35_37755 [Rhizobium ruizarguesonis]
MKNVRAIVVGVSRYYSDTWNTDGPVHNATAITRWLLDIGVPPSNIHLFSDVAEVAEQDARDLATTGVTAVTPVHHLINRFWRESLPAMAEQGDRLFFFWSGHGMTDKWSNRLFFCKDYTPKLNNSVFNMTEFLATTRSRTFQQYSSQVLFADVCGTYANAPTSPTNAGQMDIAPVDQFTAFATREGEYAAMNDSSGTFTDVLLEVLTSLDSRWPDEELFRPKLDKVSSRLSLQPYTVDIKGKNGETPRAAVGQGRRERAAYSRGAFEMLSGHDTRSIQRLHFQRTMVSLGLTSFPKLPTLWSMIEELSDLQDARDGLAPYGLIEFLARLANDPALGDASRRDIEAWIAKYGKDRLREAEERILADRQTWLLLFEVRHADGRLTELASYLRFADLTPIPGFTVETCSVDCWEKLCHAVRSRIEHPSISAHRVNLELHFLADAQLFDVPFHRIPASDGSSLGELHVCVVHSLRRALLPDNSPELERWRRWSEALCQGTFADIPLQPVQANPPPNGLCYADFPVLPAPTGTAGKIQMGRLILLGAPLLFWPHASPVEATLAEELQAMACEAMRLKGLPEILLERRLRAHPVSSDLSVLSDEWDFRPFLMTQGAG